MVPVTPLELARQLESHINSLLAGVDLLSLPAAERKVVTALKADATDSRLDVRDYEYSETREEQLRHSRAADRRLERIRKNIASASGHNLFSSADVAHLGAEIEQIIEQLK